MFKAFRLQIIFLGIILFIGSISSGWAEDCQFSCKLACNKIGPQQVETTAKGEVAFRFDEDKQELTYSLAVENIEDVYMAHLHIGPPDKQGPIAVWLYPSHEHDSMGRCIEGEFGGTLAEGVIRPEDMQQEFTFTDLIQAMRTGQAYVNVHTRKHIPGEIRGQISPQI